MSTYTSREPEMHWFDQSPRERWLVAMTNVADDNTHKHQQALPLSIQERDGHVTIYCTAKERFWSWRLYNGAVETNGRAIDSAIRHVFQRHAR